MPAAAAGGVPPLNVQIRITTTGAKAAASAMSGVTRQTNNMGRSMQAGIISTRTLGDSMRMTASLMKYTVAGAFMNMGKSAVDAYRNFELSFSRIRGLVGLGTDAVKEMQDQVLKMATETTRGPEELANALYFVTSAGIKDASTAMSVLENSAKAAAAGLGDTNTVADAVTSVLNAYGTANMSAAHATDVLVATVREGKAEADTFAPAFSKVLPVAAAFGATFEDVAAAMAALSRSGMTAGTAGIYVRQTLSQLLKPSKQAQEAMRAVGTSAEQIRQNVQDKGLFEALQILSNQLGGIENAADFAKVFGNVRALTAVLQLVGPAAAENAQIFERLNNSTGDLDDAFGEYTNTVDASFNRAFAQSRVSLIELGQAIKPIVTNLLELATGITKVFGAIVSNPIGKALATFGGGAVLAVVAFSSMLKTGSAIVRLLSNMQISLAGTQFQYDATTGKIYMMTAATRQQNAAQLNSQLTAAGWTVANGFLAKSIVRVATAMTLFMKSLGWIALIASVVSIFVGLRRSSKDSQGPVDDLAMSLGKINEVLDETVKYGKSDIVFRVALDVEETKLQTDVDRLRKQIEEQSPQFFENVRDIYKNAGEESGNAYVQALLESQFAGVTGGTRKVLIELFSQAFNIEPQEWKDVALEKTTGDAVADGIINAAVIAARGYKKHFKDVIKTDTLQGLSDAIVEGMDVQGQLTDNRVYTALGEFGKGFTDVIQERAGNIAPLVIALDELASRGALTSQVVESSFRGAFSGLTGDLDLVQDKSGDLVKIFSSDANTQALEDMVVATTGLTQTKAESFVEELRTQMQALPPGINRNKEAFMLLSNAMGEYEVKIEEVDTAQQKLLASHEMEAQALKDSIEQYENATSMIKQYETAQRGLLGIHLSQEEALRDYMDQMQELGNTTSDSGGSFSIMTEGGREARAELQKSAEAVMALANTYATEDPAKAGEVFARGIQQIAGVVAQASGEMAGVDAARVLEELGFTSEMYVNSLVAAQETAGQESFNIGEQTAAGIANGIKAGENKMTQALVTALNNVLITGKQAIESKSPSRKTARELGKPMAQGVVKGFADEAKSGKFKGGISKSLDNAIMAVYKTGNRKAISKYLSDFLEKKKNVETPAQDFVKATIGRMKDIIGSLGDYIKSQLNFRNAQADLAKLINMQRGLEDRRRKAARGQQYAETRFGMGGGAEVTGYEQAQIDQLQLDFERVSRDYAMGRASYVELVDAEIALYEARAAAAEINDDVLNSQNDFLDATVNVENRQLTLAAATVEVLSAYQDLQEAAADLYMNHKELGQVYNDLAQATGIASGKLQIGKTDIANLGTEVQKYGGFVSTVGGYVSTLGNDVGITGQAFSTQFGGPNGIFATIQKTGGDVKNLTSGIGADFTDLSRGLLNPDSELQKNLSSLGGAMWNAIKTGAEEALDASVLRLGISVRASISGGKGTLSFDVEDITDGTTNTVTTPGIVSSPYGAMPGFVNPKTGGYTGLTVPKKAEGGSVAANMPHLVGEIGPEMFIPKVSGTIVTSSALERYTRVRQRDTSSGAAAMGNNIVVTVNNPVPEAAQDSITRRMKVLANSGLFG